MTGFRAIEGKSMPLASDRGRARSRILTLLARETSSGALVPEIDGLQFLAILAVVLFHMWGNFQHHAAGIVAIPNWFAVPGHMLGNGFYGVQLFFVISGFVLGLPFARQHLRKGRPVSLAAYFKRRLFRLEPPYLINLCLLFVLSALILGRIDPAKTYGNLLASMAYVHNVIYGDGSRINYVAWSLEIEVQFYILAPLLARVFRIGDIRARRALLLIAIVTATVVSTFVIDARMPWKLTICDNLQFFLTGFLLADLYLTSWDAAPNRPLLVDAGAIVAVAVLGLGLASYAHIFQLLLPAIMFVIVYSAFRGEFCRRMFGNPWIYTIGGMCYTIYLYHFFVVGFLGHGRLLWSSLFIIDLLLQTSLTLIAVLVSSAVLFVLFEKPFMRRDWPRVLSHKVDGVVQCLRWYRD